MSQEKPDKEKEMTREEWLAQPLEVLRQKRDQMSKAGKKWPGFCRTVPAIHPGQALDKTTDD